MSLLNVIAYPLKKSADKKITQVDLQPSWGRLIVHILGGRFIPNGLPPSIQYLVGKSI